MGKAERKKTSKNAAGEPHPRKVPELAAYHAPCSPDILVYDVTSGARRSIATVTFHKHPDTGAFADCIAESICAYGECRDLLAGMIDALELCLESKLLTWEAEQEASPLVERAKRLLERSKASSANILPDISNLPLVASVR